MAAIGPPSIPNGRPPILVVEDNSSLRDVLGMLLEFERMRFVLVADGQQALDWLADHKPALVILDWRLPKVGGALVARAVRDLYGSGVPILVLSAAVDAAEAMQAGADGHLRKPYAVEDLVAAIRRLLGPGR